MKNLFKLSMPFAFAAAGMLVACSDDSSSAEEPVSEIVDLKAPFEIIVNKAKYSYNSKDSSFIKKDPVCKEGSLGNLVWKASDEEQDTLYAYINKSTIKLLDGEDLLGKFTFDGSKFPVGLWMDPDYASKSFRNAVRLTSDNMYQEVFRYDGNCFLKDYYTAGFLKDNESLEEADDVLTSFYMRFRAPNDTLNEAEMLRNIRVPDCDVIYLYDDLVKMYIYAYWLGYIYRCECLLHEESSRMVYGVFSETFMWKTFHEMMPQDGEFDIDMNAPEICRRLDMLLVGKMWKG